MEFDRVIEKRRSIRKFSNKPIEKNKIIDLIASARMSPSAANRQPWYFVVVENEKKDKIAQVMEDQLKMSDQELDSTKYATHTYQATSSLVNSIRIIREAPILIVVFRPISKDFRDADYLSIGSAVEHICLKATDYNLGSIWLRDVIYAKNEIERIFSYQDMELVVSVAIGFSNEESYPRKKKPMEAIMEWK